MDKLLILGRSMLTQANINALQAAHADMDVELCDGQPTALQLKNAAFIAGNPKPADLAHCENLRLLQLFSAGSDAYAAHMPKGALLANATGAYGLAVSEHMLATLMFLQKKLHLYQNNMQQHLWRNEGPVAAIEGATVLILGLGDIGCNFARRVHALGAHTIGVRRTGTEKPPYVNELYLQHALDDVLPRADVLAMCLPNTAETAGIMNAERFANMKNGAYFINVGRGTAVDQQALAQALVSGKLAGAAIDVTTPEPLPKEHELWAAPNLLITPHASGGDSLRQTFEKVVNIVIANIKAVRSGGQIVNEVDFGTGYRKL